jgi:hypothetical protein
VAGSVPSASLCVARNLGIPTERHSDADMVRDGRPDCVWIFEDDATLRTGNLGAECWRPTRGSVIRFEHNTDYEGPGPNW